MEQIGFKRMVRQGQERFCRHSAANIFLILALCTGIVMAYINPPFQECDGWVHYLWATDVSYGNVFRPAVNLTHEDGVLIVPKNLEEIQYRITKPDTREGGEFIRHLKSVKLSKETKRMKFSNVQSSLFYYPQALGLFLGRMFGLSVYGSVVLSRIFNLLVYLILAYIALRITPVLKNAMAVVALLPMTVFQAASDSPDAMLNGLCFLFTAMCFSFAYGERERLGWKDAVALGTVLGAVFLCKYVYACLGLLVFLIPKKKFGSKKEYWKCFGAACIPLIIIGGMSVICAASIVNINQASVGAGEVTQTQYLLGHPKFILQVLMATFVNRFNDWVQWLNMLGSLNYHLGPLITIVPMYVVFVGCLDQNEVSAKMKFRDKMICFAAFLLSSLGVVMGIYIGDGSLNEVGAQIVQGVQGRYFIAVLPAFFAAISLKGIQNKARYFTEKCLGVMGIFLLYSLYLLYSHTFC